jgi:hypothetical protein
MAQISAAKRRAALPRKSDPDGAASGQTIALSRASKYNVRARQALGVPSLSREAASQDWQNHGQQNHCQIPLSG